PPPGPRNQVRKWRQSIRAEERTLDRQIRTIDQEELKAKKMLKQVAKKGDTGACRTLAKELLHTRRHKDRLHTSKAQLNSVSMQLQNQLGAFAAVAPSSPRNCVCRRGDHSWPRGGGQGPQHADSDFGPRRT
ncbi:MAG: hypothetical protein BJ554DRAFT_2912, partial [Olpidium bornovanus]